MQSKTGFPSGHRFKSYVAPKSRLKLAARCPVSGCWPFCRDRFNTTNTVRSKPQCRAWFWVKNSKPSFTLMCSTQLKLWPFLTKMRAFLAKIWLLWQRPLCPCNQKCLLRICRPRKTPVQILVMSCRNAFVAILVPKLVAITWRPYNCPALSCWLWCINWLIDWSIDWLIDWTLSILKLLRKIIEID